MDAGGTAEAPTTARAAWASHIHSILACVGYSIGLGNVWRFPYLCYKSGGGAFMVPFIIMMILIGVPIFFVEMSVGQYSGLGPVSCFAALSPALGGIGYAVIIVITLVTIYYMVIVAWIIFYVFASFTPQFKWSSCQNDFNTNDCYSIDEEKACRRMANGSFTLYHRACREVSEVCEEFNMEFINATHCKSETQIQHLSSLVRRTLAAEEYYYNYVLGRFDHNWSDFGVPTWQLTMCLALAWLITCLCLLKGIHNAAIVLYVTIISPYVVMFALLIRGLTLEGSHEGVMFFVKPDFSLLTDPSVWGNAASEIFYTFGIACGSLVILASYNPFRNNCLRDAVYVCICNLFTMIFAGIVVFSITGFLAKEMELSVDQVADEGPGLAFVAYPEAVNRMPLPQLWSALFFLMMMMLGLSSQFGGVEAINGTIVDTWPHLRKQQWKVTVGTCTVCFLLGIPMICPGGVYLLTLMDWNTASWSILLIGVLEVISVSWTLGINEYLKCLADMDIRMSKIVHWYWKSVLAVILPAICTALFIFLMWHFERTVFDGYQFPGWADAIGILIGCTTLVAIPVYAIYVIYKREYKGWDLLRPTKEWKVRSDEGPERQGSLITARMDSERRRSRENV